MRSDLGMFCYWHVYFGVGENLIHSDGFCVYLDLIHSDGLVVDVGLDFLMLVMFGYWFMLKYMHDLVISICLDMF